MDNRAAPVGAVYATGLMQGLVVVSFPASGAYLRAMHGFSDAQYGAIFLPQTAMAIAGSLLAGGLARRLGLKALARMALCAGLAAELLLAGSAALPSGLAYAAVLVAIGLAGLGFGLSSAPLNTYPGVLFPARRETALVVLHTLIGAGFAVGPLLLGAATGAGRWILFPLALAAAAGALAVAPFPDAAAEAPAAGREAARPIRSPRFWALVAIAVVYALCEGTFSSWVGIFLQEERGVPAAGAALALSTFWGALVAGRLAVSALVLRVPSRLIWGALPVLMLLAFWLLPSAHDTASGVALFAIAGLACSAFFPLTVGFAGETFREHVAWVSSMLTASLMLGVGVGSFVLGALRDLAGLANLYRGSSAYAAVLLVLIATLRRRRPMNKQLVAVGLLCALGGTASAQTADKKTLTLEGARHVVRAVVAEARAHEAGAVVAVVDDGGNLMAVERVDGTFAAGANIAIGKARTAALFKKPTSVFEDLVNKGRTAMVAVNDFTPLMGGVPIVVDGQIVGAVGVSGAMSAKQDEEFAVAGAMSLSASAPITFIEGARVNAAFVKGMPLIENDLFKVHASHRDKAGQVEIHTGETDIIYALDGAATIVTGGKVVDGKPIAEGEIRGASIDGGETRKLAKGDVMIVPAGVPHWFKQVSGSFNYYVVKVR